MTITSTMSFDLLVSEAQRLSDVIAECERNGTVGARDYDQYGYPVGGRLTWDAVGYINGAEDDLCAIGACGGCRFCL